MYRCEECGFEHALSDAELSGPSIVEGAGECASFLRTDDAGLGHRLGRRPSDDIWSPLEYCCHVRDVLLVQRERVLLGRRAVRPSLESMGRDERVEHDGYADQDAGDVARQLTDAAAMFAHVIGRLGQDDWDRSVVYNYPLQGERSLRWVAVHTLHEVRHHLLDIRRQLA
ncbi:MAG: DinB family protein [Nocardioidaceae bacterium]